MLLHAHVEWLVLPHLRWDLARLQDDRKYKALREVRIERECTLHFLQAIIALEMARCEDEQMNVGLVLGGFHLLAHGQARANSS